MTPETYMRRYHSGCGCENEETAPIPAEALYPSCPLNTAETAVRGCGSCGQNCAEPLPTCCCKASMVEALRLLCNTELANLVDFDAFFFLTNTLAVGGSMLVPTTESDNIAALDASFQRFSPCNCDLIDVDGTAYYAAPRNTTEMLGAVEQLSLCSVKAIAFTLVTADEEGETDLGIYRRALRYLRRAIQDEGGDISGCAPCGAHCDCDDCCCDTGLLTELATRNLSRQATLTVGPLVLQNVTVLGAIGSTLVLADETNRRIYFVCVSQVEALG